MRGRIGRQEPFPSEFSLAVECCRLPESNNTARIHTLAESICWRTFLDVCRRHRVQGLVRRTLTHSDVNLPSEVQIKLHDDATRIAAAALRAVEISAKLKSLFEDEGIPVLFIKGLTVSKLAYGDPLVKMSNDIDILVPRKDIGRSGPIIEQLQYIRTVPRKGDLATWHAVKKESVWARLDYPSIELHSRLADNPGLIPALGCDSPRQFVEVSPGVELPTLADEELLIYLCVHASSSAWFRLKWLSDIVALLGRVRGRRLEGFIRDGRDHLAGRSLEATLLLANRVFDLSLGSATADVQGLVSQTLAKLGERELLKSSEPTERQFGTFGIHAAQILVQPDARSMLSESLRQARSIFRMEGLVISG